MKACSQTTEGLRHKQDAPFIDHTVMHDNKELHSQHVKTKMY